MTSIILITSCNDIFETDISEKTVDVIIPTDEDTLYSNNVHFKWNDMEGATFYNLQIVKPSFSDIESFVLDSNISKTEFFQILPPGHYEYKIRGENSAYTSLYIKGNQFYVDSVADLSDQYVLIISPIDNNYVDGNSDILVTWQNLYAANSYDVVIKTGSSFDSGTILDQVLGQPTLSHTIESDLLSIEGKYYCGIRGVNTSGATTYSYRTLYVDKTEPNAPDLISPFDDFIEEVDNLVTFKWNTGTDPGTIHSTVSSTIEISTSESFIDYTEFPTILVDSLNFTFTEIGEYWWRVKSVDAVGNESLYYSEERKITIE